MESVCRPTPLINLKPIPLKFPFMISASSIEKVRDISIVDVISRYITLKRAGSNYTGCCPFHNERSPSFMVNPTKNFYKCFGCGKAGDSISFVREKESSTFEEAIEKIAAIGGVSIDYERIDIAEAKAKKEEKDEAIALMQYAGKEYQSALYKNDTAFEYMLNRGFSHADIAEWRLGWAPEGFRFLTEKINESGRSSLALKINLLAKKDDRTHDFFSGRVMIPVEDHQGRLVAFGGRIIDSKLKTAKYINSSESLIYSKSNVLFGLNHAHYAIKKQGYAILVEGYTDVIRLHSVGFPIAVASCGTAFTAEQAKLLKRYCGSVVIMRDGDSAGMKAAMKDVNIAIAEGFIAYAAILPEKEDPDSFFRSDRVVWMMENIKDAIVWKAMVIRDEWVKLGKDIAGKTDALDQIVEMLLCIKSPNRRDEYIKQVAPLMEMKPTEMQKAIKRRQDEFEIERSKDMESEDGALPKWVKEHDLYANGFVQNFENSKEHPMGMYFLNNNGSGITRSTNFTVKPLYHLYDSINNRRLIEVSNYRQTSFIEMPSRAMISLDAFEIALIEKGAFTTDPTFTKANFKRMAAWMSDNMRKAYELKTLGWQTLEGFFAFSNKVIYNDEQLDYNEMGAVDINDVSFISMGISNIQKDFRQENNIYENDLYLKHVETKVSFSEWAELFNKVYPDNGPFGIAFVLISLFKDRVVHVTKVPHLYCYGPKGSGKSDFAESLTWLFFSGKNSDGKLIQGFNLNPGQSTVFSFFSRLERFRNCPALFNEFDEDMIEDYKFGAFKAAYDGEGREVGEGDTGKARKTKIQKVQGTCILVGQYLSVRDDGSVLSRSISAEFRLERVKKLTEQDMKNHRQLKDMEEKGLSGIIVELLKHRDSITDALRPEFLEVYKSITSDTRAAGINAETRILRNYTLCATMIKIASGIWKLPFTYNEFYKKCLDTVISHNRMLRDNSALANFWKIIEFAFDQKLISLGFAFDIELKSNLEVVRDRDTKELTFEKQTQILMLRFSNLYGIYSKLYKDRTGNKAPEEETLLTYLKDQPYYVGLVRIHGFKDKRTSCYAVRYNDLGIVMNGGDGMLPDGTPPDSPPF